MRAGPQRVGSISLDLEQQNSNVFAHMQGCGEITHMYDAVRKPMSTSLLGTPARHLQRCDWLNDCQVPHLTVIT